MVCDYVYVFGCSLSTINDHTHTGICPDPAYSVTYLFISFYLHLRRHFSLMTHFVKFQCDFFKLIIYFNTEVNIYCNDDREIFLTYLIKDRGCTSMDMQTSNSELGREISLVHVCPVQQRR